MTLEELKEACQNQKVVVVTGMQRSGTHIASLVIADLTGKARVVESEFSVNNWDKFKKFLKMDNLVIQAPALSHEILKIVKLNAFVVYMRRPFKEIHPSLTKLWSPADFKAEMLSNKTFKVILYSKAERPHLIMLLKKRPVSMGMCLAVKHLKRI